MWDAARTSPTIPIPCRVSICRVQLDLGGPVERAQNTRRKGLKHGQLTISKSRRDYRSLNPE